MKPYLRLLVGAAIASAVAASVAAQRGTSDVPLTVQGLTRRYLVHVPDAAGASRTPLPLVLAFHGGGETPENQQSISGLDRLADRERFIVAYPEGIGRSWADGRGTTKADTQGVDDVAFARAVVADIASRYPVDRARVYATGASNGGIFANTLGCRAADTFAAVAPVIGTIATRIAATCRPSAAMPIVGVQGVADPVVPFGGGDVGGTLEGAAAGGQVQGSRATQELWRTLNGCRADAAETKLPIAIQDGTSVTRREYTGCRDGANVVWYEITGGGHRWPPRQARPAMERMIDRLLGVSSRNVDASDVIWAFFAAHARGAAR